MESSEVFAVGGALLLVMLGATVFSQRRRVHTITIAGTIHVGLTGNSPMEVDDEVGRRTGVCQTSGVTGLGHCW